MSGDPNDRGSGAIDYRAAGVDVAAGQQVVRDIGATVAATHGPEVLGDLGAFAGLYALGSYRDPVLVSGTDGVGTKVELARAAGLWDTIGIDLVGMCVNDVVCHGARPLFFLDYIAVDRLDAVEVPAVVSGVAEGCRRARCALIGGETAEMPGVYRPGRFDLAGFCVGVVEREALVDGSALEPGMAVVGLASSGFHSNGYSLLRRLFPEIESADGTVGGGAASDGSMTEAARLRDELLTPTRIYAAVVADLMQSCRVAGLAHVTGGGWWENLPRLLGTVRDRHTLRVDAAALAPPAVFDVLAGTTVTPAEAYRTFNMGLGMACAMPSEDVNGAMEVAASHGIDAAVIGTVAPRDGDREIVVSGVPDSWQTWRAQFA